MNGAIVPSNAGVAAGAGVPAPGSAEEKKNTDCRFFMMGVCQKGPACEYRHSAAAKFNPVECAFWAANKCAKSDCPYRHPLRAWAPPAASYPARSGTPCIYHLQGKCAKGSTCPYSHAVAAPSASLASVTISSEELNTGLEASSMRPYPAQPVAVPVQKPLASATVTATPGGVAVAITKGSALGQGPHVGGPVGSAVPGVTDAAGSAPSRRMIVQRRAPDASTQPAHPGSSRGPGLDTAGASAVVTITRRTGNLVPISAGGGARGGAAKDAPALAGARPDGRQGVGTGVGGPGGVQRVLTRVAGGPARRRSEGEGDMGDVAAGGGGRREPYRAADEMDRDGDQDRYDDGHDYDRNDDDGYYEYNNEDDEMGMQARGERGGGGRVGRQESRREGGRAPGRDGDSGQMFSRSVRSVRLQQEVELGGAARPWSSVRAFGGRGGGELLQVQAKVVAERGAVGVVRRAVLVGGGDLRVDLRRGTNGSLVRGGREGEEREEEEDERVIRAPRGAGVAGGGAVSHLSGGAITGERGAGRQRAGDQRKARGSRSRSRSLEAGEISGGGSEDAYEDGSEEGEERRHVRREFKRRVRDVDNDDGEEGDDDGGARQGRARRHVGQRVVVVADDRRVERGGDRKRGSRGEDEEGGGDEDEGGR